VFETKGRNDNLQCGIRRNQTLHDMSSPSSAAIAELMMHRDAILFQERMSPEQQQQQQLPTPSSDEMIDPVDLFIDTRRTISPRHSFLTFQHSPTQSPRLFSPRNDIELQFNVPLSSSSATSDTSSDRKVSFQMDRLETGVLDDYKDSSNADIPILNAEEPLRIRALHRLRRIRMTIYDTFDKPSSSKIAQFISFFLIIMIIFSACSMCIQSLPQFYDIDNYLWWSVETFIIIVFTSEFLIRLLCTPNLFYFCTDILNVLDFIAIIPYYLDVVLSLTTVNLNVVRVIRVVRVLRVFKVSRYSKPLQVMMSVLRDSLDVLYLSAVFISIALMVFASLMYYLERGDWDPLIKQWNRCISYDPFNGACVTTERSPYQSIVHSFWWAITTLTSMLLFNRVFQLY
jgi:hypothetical protein